MSAAEYLCPRGVTAVATDTWGVEVKPYETEDMMAPLHVVFLINAGIYLGEMWDLEALDIFWLAAAASAASMLAAVFIPRAAGVRRPPASAVGAAELVVQGRVLAPYHRPLTPAVVTVLRTDGDPVDWSRVDTEGNYSVALPGAGKYLMVANAGGWAPMAEVFDFDGRTLKQNLLLRDRLQVCGTVGADGASVSGAVVTLLEAGGGHVGTTRTDGNGGCALLYSKSAALRHNESLRQRNRPLLCTVVGPPPD